MRGAHSPVKSVCANADLPVGITMNAGNTTASQNRRDMMKSLLTELGIRRVDPLNPRDPRCLIRDRRC
jgi:hypothetical protein